MDTGAPALGVRTAIGYLPGLHIPETLEVINYRLSVEKLNLTHHTQSSQQLTPV